MKTMQMTVSLGKLNENSADDCQFPVMVEVCQNKAAKTDI